MYNIYGVSLFTQLTYLFAKSTWSMLMPSSSIVPSDETCNLVSSFLDSNQHGNASLFIRLRENVTVPCGAANH